ncbi:hypothetical protein SAMN05421805_12236 [Saccharopolyspora antimicrobica]|uniref:DUF308 domain-containing protein n=1 Tax=Saccharopolyspora antimicrobica TaxID=455193 RepID=A0A1I5JC07_9PSEU|nr:hypothetical protein [Saccharopolyspora antimicrobica]RKT82463.1 hypothetical protein ATL45_0711 [Saccharopolyspora antimicrobica]SFO70368.1 hypothetical protein SAMN05421805_12236 [Saccharopolyspora antimicrobica]
MSTRRDNADGPEDIDAAFAEIVADLERDENFARWPDDDEPAAAGERPEAPPVAAGPTAAAPVESGPRDWAAPANEEDEHYVPPEPPPLPTPRPTTMAGIVVVVIGVLFALVPGLAGLSGTITLPLGLVLISGGIGWLLLRLRQPPRNSDDDGAQV